MGDWWYSSTRSLTSALDEGEWQASRAGHFTGGKGHLHLLNWKEAGWASERTWTRRRKTKIPSLLLPEIESLSFSPKPSHYTEIIRLVHFNIILPSPCLNKGDFD